MKRRSCTNCIFYNSCLEEDTRACEDYFPSDDDEELHSLLLDEYIEKERNSFRKEWLEYIESEQDEPFMHF